APHESFANFASLRDTQLPLLTPALTPSKLSGGLLAADFRRGSMSINRRVFLHHGTAAAGLWVGRRLWAADAKSNGAGPAVDTTAGKIRGAMQGRTAAFKGVPYGASTEGARFLPPSKVQPWTGVRDALELGPASPQNPSNLIPEAMAQQPPNDANGTEDCL